MVSAIGLWSIFTARRYAKRSTCRRRVSVRPSVRLSIRLQIILHDRPGTQIVFKWDVVAEFLLTRASRGPSAIAEPLVLNDGHMV